MFFYLLPLFPPPFLVSLPFLFCSFLVTSNFLVSESNAWILSLPELAFLPILQVLLLSACISPTIPFIFQPFSSPRKCPCDHLTPPPPHLSPHKSIIFLFGLKESFPTVCKDLHFVPLLLAAASKPSTSIAWAPSVGISHLDFRRHHMKASNTSYSLKNVFHEKLSRACYAGTLTQHWIHTDFKTTIHPNHLCYSKHN